MKIYISIDDTDSLESPGSGHLAQMLARDLQQAGLIVSSSNITRHQLYFHDDIPYTSHNSAMCFSVDTESDAMGDIILYSQQFLEKQSAPGSDPGLCIAPAERGSDISSLVAFGSRAKTEVISKEEAYWLADQTGVHLSEHGGTGDGVIGALAGIALRLTGNDGRFRGWLDFGRIGNILHARELCSHPAVDQIVNAQGELLPEDARIVLSDCKLKTVHINHSQVIPVKPSEYPAEVLWSTLTRTEIKKF